MKNNLLRDYQHAQDGQLGDYAINVGTKMTNNPNFTTPKVPPATLIAKGEAFNQSVAISLTGTTADTAHKKALRAELIALLDTVAADVELTAANDPEIILSAGFPLASTNRAPGAPGMTSIVSVTNPSTTRMGLNLAPAENARAVIVEYTALPNGPTKTVTFTDINNVVLTGTIPGTMYSIRVAVMAAKNQISDFCEPVQHMST